MTAARAPAPAGRMDMCSELPRYPGPAIVCRKCAREARHVIDARQHMRLEAIITEDGLQLWCARHEQNVARFHLPLPAAAPPGASQASSAPPTTRAAGSEPH